MTVESIQKDYMEVTQQTDLSRTPMDFSRRNMFSEGVAACLTILEKDFPELHSKISSTQQGDSGLFSDEELLTMVTVLNRVEQAKNRPDSQEIDGNFLESYARHRWSNGENTSVSAFWKSDGDKSFHRENVAAKFWSRFPGKDNAETNLNRVRFYMNMSRDEAEAYANSSLYAKGPTIEIRAT